MMDALAGRERLEPGRVDLLERIDTPLFTALLCLVSLIPVLVVDMPPLVDLYGHIGRFAVQTDLANRPELQPYYSYEWRLIGNLGADLLVEVLHRWLGLEGAVRAVVILAQLLATLGILAVSREVHGRISPYAIAALPLIYGYPFNFGFLNFALGMALALLAFALWLRLRRLGRERAAGLWLAGAGVVIWVCHTYGWAFLGLLCGSAMLAEVIAARAKPVAFVARILGACWPLLLPLVPMLLWRAEAGGAFTGGWSAFHKFNWLFSVMRTRWAYLDLGSLAFLLGLLVWAIWRKDVRMDGRLSIAAGLSFACFAILPMYVIGSAYADMRLLPYALALALIAAGPRVTGGRVLGVVTALALVFFAGRSVTTAAAYVEQDRAVAEVTPALDSIPRGARLAFFVVDQCRAHWTLPVFDHLGGLALARRSVFVNDQWQGPGVNPLIVHYKAAGSFAHDPSQAVLPDNCRRKTRRRHLTKALEALPRNAFTHVWIIGQVTDKQTFPEGFTPVEHRGKGWVLAVTPPAKP
jgi:hypothetical protein